MEEEKKEPETEEVAEAEVETSAAPAAEGEAKEAKEPRAKKNFKKQNFKKVCMFCQEKSQINYKDVAKLRKFISEGGKILPRRMTGTCARHQRELAVAIKRARVAALLPFKAD